MTTREHNVLEEEAITVGISEYHEVYFEQFLREHLMKEVRATRQEIKDAYERHLPGELLNSHLPILMEQGVVVRNEDKTY